jgi:hypothetical protein
VNEGENKRKNTKQKGNPSKLQSQNNGVGELFAVNDGLIDGDKAKDIREGVTNVGDFFDVACARSGLDAAIAKAQQPHDPDMLRLAPLADHGRIVEINVNRGFDIHKSRRWRWDNRRSENHKASTRTYRDCT